jgi:hypothetical protein
MHLTLVLVLTVFILLRPGSVFGQQWVEFSSRQDSFFVNFPEQPKVEEFSYTTEQEAQLPARRYVAQRGPSRFSVTVIDYTRMEEIATERAKKCPPDAHAGCAGSGVSGVGYWKVEKAGAVDWATWNIIKRGSNVTYFGWQNIDLVAGRFIHLTNPDGSRTYIGLNMHEDRLYILEGTVPKAYPEPGMFLQSLRFLDAQGRPIRYQDGWFYLNGYPKPPLTGGGRGAGAGGRGAGAAAQ